MRRSMTSRLCGTRSIVAYENYGGRFVFLYLGNGEF
jgi:hypothetical protein